MKNSSYPTVGTLFAQSPGRQWIQLGAFGQFAHIFYVKVNSDPKVDSCLALLLVFVFTQNGEVCTDNASVAYLPELFAVRNSDIFPRQIFVRCLSIAGRVQEGRFFWEPLMANSCWSLRARVAQIISEFVDIHLLPPLSLCPNNHNHNNNRTTTQHRTIQPQQQQYNLERLRFHRRGASTPTLES